MHVAAPLLLLLLLHAPDCKASSATRHAGFHNARIGAPAFQALIAANALP